MYVLRKKGFCSKRFQRCNDHFFVRRKPLNMKNAVTFKYDSLLSIWEEMFFEYVHFLFKNILVAQIHFQYMCCCRRLVWRGIYTRSCNAGSKSAFSKKTYFERSRPKQGMLRTPKDVVLRRRGSLRSERGKLRVRMRNSSSSPKVVSPCLEVLEIIANQKNNVIS